MKKLLLLMIVLIALTACSTSQKSVESNANSHSDIVEIAGAYRGLMPCADCEGIRTEIILDERGRYNISRVYLGKRGSRFHDSGLFRYDSLSGVVELIDRKGNKEGSYLYEDGNLVMLDADGNKIEGELAQMYVQERAEEYDLVVFDSGFDYWLRTNPVSVDYYSNDYLQSMNIRYVQEWNRRYLRGDRRIESYVDYNPSENVQQGF